MSISSKMSKFLKNPLTYFSILFLINLIYFVDRGLIPGSSNEFNSFISKNLKTRSPDAYLGMLQSAFIIGLLLSSVVFGRLTHYYNPFVLVKYGVMIWTLSVIISAISFYANSFILLIIGRMLSGVGEGSFQCTIPPWIEANAPSGSRARWLSIFYTAMPVGTAIGYAYSAGITAGISWDYAYWIEGLAMFPLLLVLQLMVYLFHNPSPSHPTPNINDPSFQKDGIEYVRSAADEDHMHGHDYAECKDGVLCSGSSLADEWDTEVEFCADLHASKANDTSTPPTILEEASEVLSHPIYLCVVAGYAAQTGSIVGLATFGSSLVMGLGFFKTETAASSAFGIVVSVAGLVGTPLGGVLLDRQIRRLSLLRSESRATTLRTATAHITILNLLGIVFLGLVPLAQNKGLFLTLACVGCVFVFASTTGIAMAVLESVRPNARAFAMALVTVFIHIFGDVPSPILVGLLKDRLAPSCTGKNSMTSPACAEESLGLRVTILVVVLWLGWSVLFFGLSWRLAVRNSKKSAALLVASDAMREPLITSKVIV